MTAHGITLVEDRKPIPVRIGSGPLDRIAFAFGMSDHADIVPRGNDVAVIANKLIVIALRLARPSARLLWQRPLLVLAAPIVGAFLLVAHLSLALGLGSVDDPLGYGFTARKPG